MNGAATWRVVSGDPTPEEIAALTVVFTMLLRAGSETPASPAAAYPGRGHGRGWRTRPRPGWRRDRFAG